MAEASSPQETGESASKHPVVVLDKVDEYFRELIRSIISCCLVGLTSEGEQIGCNRNLSLLQIATEDCTYVYDILCLGDLPIFRGLCQVLENADILKVIFSC